MLDGVERTADDRRHRSRKTTGKTQPKAETRKRATKVVEAPSVAHDTPVAATMGAVSRDAIADLAYQLFLQRGAQHGSDIDDWVAAERMLSAN